MGGESMRATSAALQLKSLGELGSLFIQPITFNLNASIFNFSTCEPSIFSTFQFGPLGTCYEVSLQQHPVADEFT